MEKVWNEYGDQLAGLTSWSEYARNRGTFCLQLVKGLCTSGHGRFRMNLKFRHKVFLTFLLNSLIVVVCMILIGRYFSERHFEEYVSKVEAEMVTKLVDALSQEYRRSGNFDSVLQDPGLWFGLRWVGPGMPPRTGMTGPPPLHFDLLSAERERVPPPPGELIPLPPGPPPLHFDPLSTEKERVPPPPGELILLPPGPPPQHLAIPPIALFDTEKRPLTAGNSVSQDNYRLTPIKADAQLVGWLGLRKHERPTHHLDVEFLRQQSQIFYAIGAVALILAVFVTLVLSRHLLAPVKELETGTRALSFRRFDTRIAVRSNDELGQLAAGFNSMAQALEKHQQTEHQWLVDISHELRTPLAILRGEIEAMQDGVRKVTRQGLDSLHLEVMHLGRIVSDLHDLSLIESRSFSSELTAVNPLEIMTETLECFRTRLNQRGIEIDMHETMERDILIPADADRLKQVFSNLLENTLRYAKVPGFLKISHEVGSGELSVSFEDSGPGVAEESLAHLFDRLYRVDRARSREHGGSGLGLAICKSIVESFGGKIEASNSPAGGLKVSMVLPRCNGLRL
jgi:two-component system sensor histidine kinase BaeS